MTSPGRRCTQCPPLPCSQLGGCSVNDLGDVDTSTVPPTPGQVLVWDGTQWVAGPRFDCGDLAACSIDQLGDVDTVAAPPAPGQVLIWNGVQWVPGAAPFDCGQLAACSVDALGDVDTVTAPPAPGEVLIWDGSQWVPGAAPAPALTTACGLAGNGSAATPLQVSTSAVWGDGSLPYACPDTSGAPVYCDTAGAVRTAPERFYETMQMQMQVSGSPAPVTDFVAPGDPLTELDRITATFTNPSPCLPFKGMAEVAITHAEFVFERGDYLNVALYSGLDITGAATASTRTHQHWWFHNVDTVRPLVDTTNVTKIPVTIPPGGTITLALIASMILGNYTGTDPLLLVNGMVFQANLWGGN